MKKSILTKKQVKKFRCDYYEDGKPHTIIAKVRYDDECGNGHNSFAITGSIFGPDRYLGETTVTHKSGRMLWNFAGGCCHEEIAKHFPELAPLIKWHLTSSDGPWGYIGNTVYFAGDRDHWGTRKGEVRSYQTRVRFGKMTFAVSKLLPFLEAGNLTPETLAPVEVPHINRPGDSYKYSPKYTFAGFPVKAWHECPFDSLRECQEWADSILDGFTLEKVPDAWGEGKERQLDAARAAAVWPDATDEDLTAPGLEERLKARLPALMDEFCAAVESLGFTY